MEIVEDFMKNLEGNKAIAVGKCLNGCGMKFQKGPKVLRFG